MNQIKKCRGFFICLWVFRCQCKLTAAAVLARKYCVKWKRRMWVEMLLAEGLRGSPAPRGGTCLSRIMWAPLSLSCLCQQQPRMSLWFVELRGCSVEGQSRGRWRWVPKSTPASAWDSWMRKCSTWALTEILQVLWYQRLAADYWL